MVEPLVTSVEPSAEVELMEPMPLVMELMLPWEPAAAAGAPMPGPTGLSSDGLVTCDELDIEPLELVFVSTAGGWQYAYATRYCDLLTIFLIQRSYYACRILHLRIESNTFL